MSVEVRCTGCGGRLPLASGQAALQGEKLLESLQESPPFCVVCSCRTVVGPGPGTEVWESIEERREPTKTVVAVEEMHDDCTF